MKSFSGRGVKLLRVRAAVLVAMAGFGLDLSTASAQVGTLSGTIGFSGGGNEPELMNVFLHPADSGGSASSVQTTASEGWNFAADNLPAGDYRVQFRPQGGAYASEWWKDAAGPETAAVVTVSAGSTTTVSPTLNLRPATIIWREDTSGSLSAWLMEGVVRTGEASILQDTAPAGSDLAGTGDFNGDGNADILWRQRSGGNLDVWYMDGIARIGESRLSRNRTDVSSTVVGIRDFNGDGKVDILWRQRLGGRLHVWYLDGMKRTGGAFTSPRTAPANWKVAGTGDFNGDGHADILWRKADGDLYVWYMDGVTRAGGEFTSPRRAPPGWSVSAVGDFSGDEKPDILWRTPEGDQYVWYMDGVTRTDGSFLSPPREPGKWKVVGFDVFPFVEPVETGNCEDCHDGTVALAPNVMTYWAGSAAGQDGGHGDRGGFAAVACTACHDINLPSGPTSARHGTGVYNSIWDNDSTRSTNTAHLKVEFFTKYPAVGAGDWSIQVAMDNYCTYECHDLNRNDVQDTGEPAKSMRHEVDTLPTDADHHSMWFGSHLTPPQGAQPDTIPGILIDLDLNTGAAGGGNYAPCVSCHDPHGTGTAAPRTYPSNRMVRYEFPVANDPSMSSELCSKCHR